jgi:hypothetical protein
VNDRPFILLLLVLVVLIAVAIWQFYSLAWGESAASLRRMNGATSVATVPKRGDYILPW